MLDELMDKGAAAEQAKAYLTSLVKDAKEQIFDRIIALNPDQTMFFTVYKAQIQALDDIMLVVEADINAGKKAIETVQGNQPDQKGGIL